MSERGKKMEKSFKCDDAISRQAAQTELKNCEVVDVRDENDNLVGYYNADTVDSIVRNLPPVTPQKYGKWIDYSDEGFVECPFCGHATNCEDNINELHYCFHCGAKMQESEEV